MAFFGQTLPKFDLNLASNCSKFYRTFLANYVLIFPNFAFEVISRYS